MTIIITSQIPYLQIHDMGGQDFNLWTVGPHISDLQHTPMEGSEGAWYVPQEQIVKAAHLWF